MAAHYHRENSAQTLTGVIGSSTKRAKGASTKRFRKEQWEGDWQRHLETLRQCICELLIKNQHLRMGADKPSQE